MSLTRIFSLSVVPLLALSVLASARADGNCDAATVSQLSAFERLADSIRVDKPGLARVYASNGAEFTAGQALWMKGQLREVHAACARGDETEAVHRLDSVEGLIRAHTHQNL